MQVKIAAVATGVVALAMAGAVASGYTGALLNNLALQSWGMTLLFAAMLLFIAGLIVKYK